MTAPAFPPIEVLLPHRRRMLLINGIVAHGEDETTCAAEITPTSIVVTAEGRVERWAALEYMAQTIAVHAGLASWREGSSIRLGFLIGCRRVEFRGALRAGQRLVVTARRLWGQSNLGLFACALRDRTSDAVLAEGELSVALADAMPRP